MSTGTPTRGPITAAKAWPDPMHKTATATAIASSKLLLAAINDRVHAWFLAIYCNYLLLG